MKTLGQVGYEAYAEHQEWKNFQGNPIPHWDTLREDIKAAWEVSAQASADEAIKRERAL